MKVRTGFKSLLDPEIEQFTAKKRLVKRRCDFEEKTLGLFDDH